MAIALTNDVVVIGQLALERVLPREIRECGASLPSDLSDSLQVPSTEDSWYLIRDDQNQPVAVVHDYYPGTTRSYVGGYWELSGANHLPTVITCLFECGAERVFLLKQAIEYLGYHGDRFAWGQPVELKTGDYAGLWYRLGAPHRHH